MTTTMKTCGVSGDNYKEIFKVFEDGSLRVVTDSDFVILSSSLTHELYKYLTAYYSRILFEDFNFLKVDNNGDKND